MMIYVDAARALFFFCFVEFVLPLHETPLLLHSVANRNIRSGDLFQMQLRTTGGRRHRHVFACEAFALERYRAIHPRIIAS